MSNVPPLPPRLLPGHDRILGVMFEGTLTHARKPTLRFTFVRCCGLLTASIPHGLAAYRQHRRPFMQLLSLAVASDRPRKGLSPSNTQPCPTHLRTLIAPVAASISKASAPLPPTRENSKDGVASLSLAVSWPMMAPALASSRTENCWSSTVGPNSFWSLMSIER